MDEFRLIVERCLADVIRKPTHPRTGNPLNVRNMIEYRLREWLRQHG